MIFSSTQLLEFAVCDTGLLIRKLYNIHAKTLGLNVLDRRALIHIHFRPNLTQVELAGHLEIEAQNLIRVLDRLVSQGYIEKVAHPSDRRAKCIQITDKGNHILNRLNHKVAQSYQQMLEGISEEDQTALLNTLEALKSNLSQVLSTLEEERK
ncbi:MarR family winged helix-turn-helix transcriptional regulator [Fangia hongkongensis]|uniref:MarR family winged helix-turn-helix transcriptional regulator n=1 Tax=Fangia hongkongensis TaxID=270495 RepID=UPI000380F46E|nr:MarR family transcriptional regulator [Fangia hongkongensis]MBK2125501.1 MarR family transcriptional regulator [Fangia hongkongensis]